jgi:uncharacterized protein
MKPKNMATGKKTTASARPRRTLSKASASSATPAEDSSDKSRKTESTASRAPRKTVRSSTGDKSSIEIPSILLEGDRPSPASVSGPGQRYALGPTPLVEDFGEEGELPEAYGTQQLLLAARDPHWLYAHWDIEQKQQRHFNSLSRDRHLVLRVHQDALSGPLAAEVHVHPESRHWFVHVDRAGKKYIAELGYYQMNGTWTTVSTSGTTLTPPDTMSSDTTAEFATVPFEVPISKLLSLVKEAVREHKPLAQALQQLRAEGHKDLPSLSAATAPKWTPAQERALAEVISMDHVRRVWMGSLEITELIRRQVVHDLASMSAAQFSLPTSPMGMSSPMGGKLPGPKGFWFNINAELIIYGATEADATVAIGGRPIRLRPDGTFSYRFALPDGEYELPVVAISADETDGRAAEIRFSRGTEYRGEVGAHPQDPGLKRPEAANL